MTIGKERGRERGRSRWPAMISRSNRRCDLAFQSKLGKSLDLSKLFYARSIAFSFVFLVGFVMTILWSIRNNYAKQAIYEALGDAHASLFAHVRDRAHVLAQSSSYAYNLARILGSLIETNLSSIYEIESKVAPGLFFTFSAMPQASVMAYIGHDGLLFSYYRELNQTYAIFSNERRPFDASNVSYQFYIQPVDVDAGVRYGNATTYSPVESNGLKWIHDSLNCRNNYVAWGLGFEQFLEALFLFSAPMGKVGVVSVGIKVKDFANSVTSVNLFGGHQYLAMGNGHPLAYTGPPNIIYALGNGSFSVLTMDHSNIEQKTMNFSCHGNNLSLFGPTTMESNYLSIEGKAYRFSCAPFDASGIHLVSIMATPCKDNISIFKKMNIAVISLFLFLVFCVIVWSIIAGMIFNKVKIREMQLCYALIKQKEATQQAERKSMNKSMAFSQASHDVRTSLISITCLIELCRSLVSPSSDLDENLVQMNVYASKLLDILNSVLDTSRVEAGKMQLEEREFNMAQVIQESLDSFYIAAQNKGLEMIWDPTDFSIFKYSNVKGDCRRFSQILDNLLGNAIKFTPQGHISFYGWARKPTFEKYNIASKQRFRWASHLFFKNEDPCVSNTSNTIQNDPNYVEFTFEVDDSGIGIPKERRASIFENYVQVKESSHGGHEGTGLGLGIVQSFVRLMGGEIGIQDKEHGKKGTCFRFNVFMKSCDTSRGEVISSTNNQASNQSTHVALWNYIGFQSVQTRTFPGNLKMENFHILLLIQGDETRKVAKRWLEGFGGKLWGTNYPRFLQSALEKIKHKLLNNSSGSGKYDLLSLSISSSKSVSLDVNGELEISSDDHTLPFTKRDLSKRSNINKCTSYLMVLIDLNVEDLLEICSMLNNFSQNIQNIQNIQFKVVWLAKSNAHSEDLSKVKGTRCDLILKRPLYGSHLYPLFSLFQEFEETSESEPIEFNTMEEIQKVKDANRLPSLVGNNEVPLHKKGRSLSNSELEITELKDDDPNTNELNGMNILLVEDSLVISHYEFLLLSKLGAKVEISRNGLEALDKVKASLHKTMNAIGTSQKQKIYDVILMDCEMPIMDGYEATKQIRMEENQYGHHIPIIALTAHGTREEEQRAILSGMDSYLEKPLREHTLLEAIHNFS